MVILETERLLLRMFRESDLDAWAEICAQEIVMRYISAGKTLSREEAWRDMTLMLGHWQLRGYGLWAVEARQSGTLIGRVGCWNPEGWPGFEVGWMLGRQHWGHGYAIEGARAALKYAFTVLKVPHVISLIYPENAPSIRLAHKLGEQLEGTTEISSIPGIQLCVYGIHREVWERLRPDSTAPN
jgi:RimJ/RimL family protein N-acetyltransferase